MRILVTGGAGFIGSNLVRRVVKDGALDVDVVDDLSSGQISFLPSAVLDSDSFFVSDFAAPAVIDAVSSGRYDAIVHLAAQPRVSYSVEKPYETYQNNVASTLKLIEASRGHTKRFVFASTCAVYGDTSSLPTHESAPKNYRSPYAMQKLMVEDCLRLYNNLYGFDSVCLRFFNVFGPNQLGDSPYSTSVSAWIYAILRGSSMRSDGDGSQSRDMCHVDNVVDACIKAVVSPNHFRGEAFNIACGQSVTNSEILRALLKQFPQAKYHSAPWRPGDIMHTLADISAAKERLDYAPSVMFWEGLESTIRWYQDNWERIESMKSE